MKHIRTIFCILIFFGIGFVNLVAQNTLYINSKAGSNTPFTVSDIRKLTFEAGKLTVSNIDATNSSFWIADVKNLTFNNITFIPEIKETGSSTMSIYPNPAIDEIHIQYSTFTTEKIHVQIVDLLGKVVLEKTFYNLAGTNNNILSVLSLNHGLYIIRLQNETHLETIKFLKD